MSRLLKAFTRSSLLSSEPTVADTLLGVETLSAENRLNMKDIEEEILVIFETYHLITD